MANGNPWFTAVEQTLPEYVPLPMEQLFQAGQAIQGRYDTSMAAIDQMETGLGSMQAIAPAHRQYRDKLVTNYRREASDLLDRFNSNASDPQFIREMRRLNTRYSSDPNLQIIAQANQQYQAKQKAIQDIQAKGGKYIDTNPRFTGVDAQGNLSYDVGTVRQTDFENQIRQAFQDTQKAITNNGSLRTNKPALDSVMQSMIQGAGTNPVTRDALQYYMQQGYTPEQAQAQLANTLQQQYASNLIQERDDTNERLAISRANLGIAQKRLQLDQLELQDKLAAKQAAGNLVPVVSPIEAKNLNESLISDVDRVIGSLSKAGNLQPRNLTVPYTQENLAKYPNAEVIRGGSAGIGAAGTTLLRIPEAAGVQQSDADLLRTARETLGIRGGTAKEVLNRYKQFLQADNNAPTFWNTPVKENKQMIIDNYIGSNGENLADAVYVDKDGSSKRVADGDVTLKGFKGFNFAGVTTSPVSAGKTRIEGGALKINALDENGDLVTFYKPLDPVLQGSTQVSNLIGQVLTSGKSNDAIAKDMNFRRVIDGVPVVPQRNRTGGVDFYQIDNNGNRIGRPIDASGIISAEHNAISQYFRQFTNK